MRLRTSGITASSGQDSGALLFTKQPVSLFNYYKIVKTQSHGSGNMKSGLISAAGMKMISVL